MWPLSLPHVSCGRDMVRTTCAGHSLTIFFVRMSFDSLSLSLSLSLYLSPSLSWSWPSFVSLSIHLSLMFKLLKLLKFDRKKTKKKYFSFSTSLPLHLSSLPLHLSSLLTLFHFMRPFFISSSNPQRCDPAKRCKKKKLKKDVVKKKP